MASCLWCGAGVTANPEELTVGCGRCGTRTTSPFPTEAELEEAYRGWYRPDSGRFLGLGDAFLRRSRSMLAARIDNAAPSGAVLDVGAGDGTLIDALRGVGRQTMGLELESRHPDIAELDIQDVSGTWGAIIFWHSLEHLPRPRESVRRAVQLLATGGLLIVAVPNISSIQARLFKDRWFALDLPRHLVHLSRAALIDGLEEEGLVVARVSDVRGGQVLFGWLHGLVGLWPGRPNLYTAIRRPEARDQRMGRLQKLTAYVAAVVMLAPALIASIAECAFRRGGTTYVEARRV